MGCATCGRIKGYVRHEEIYNFIKQKYDRYAEMHIERDVICQISELNYPHKVNSHSEDNSNLIEYHGYIDFKYGVEDRSLFYLYANVNHLKNLVYYTEHNLENMVKAETTFISMGLWGSSVEIIKEIVAHFGGGWVDENDCDDLEYEPIEVDSDGEIKPVLHVTMDDIYKKFGSIVIIDG